MNARAALLGPQGPSMLPSPPDMARFRDLHAGATVLVCGCGPSLDAIAGGVPCPTIGVNDAGRVLETDYLVVVNPRSQFTPERLKVIEDTHARAVFSQLGEWRPRHAPLVRFRLGSYNGVDRPHLEDTLHYTQNSPYVALCLAMHLGARRIGLLGVDFAAPHPLARHLAQIDAEYGKLVVAARARGVEIVNVSAQSCLTSLARQPLEAFLGAGATAGRCRSLAIVSYATTPIAGVPAVLARCIGERTRHRARCVWATDDYGNGVRFDGGVAWRSDPASVIPSLRAADLVILHNGKVHERHREAILDKPTITMAHNYAWNVDLSWVERGGPGVVVGQYQATLPEFREWTMVPNPLPWWEAPFSPGDKNGPVRICYTPSGPHERYPEGHRLYWHGKGYDTTLRVLDGLAKRFPIVVETTRQRQVSHAESLAMKRRAHIVIDECVTGSYHRNSLEGLATGCVVVNGVGLVPAIADALLDCTAPRAAASPFVFADLARLESVLSGLIALGGPELAARGAQGREWLETHWRFPDQWEARWADVVERALDAKPRRPARVRTPEVPPPAVAQRPEGLSVVVPHGGADRVRILAATIALLKQNTAVNEIIIAEGGERPLACDIARRWGVGHVFVQISGAFNKSRVLNAGSALARFDLVLWWDNDLLFPGPSLEGAIAEMREQRFDVFLPFFRIVYLDESDSAKINKGVLSPADARTTAVLEALHGAPGGLVMVRSAFIDMFGGMCEEFRGWGGEDCAWLHKARLLGHVGVTAAHDRIAYHQWHRASGSFGGDPRLRNGAYHENAALWAEIARLSTRDALLARLPAPRYPPLPWSSDVQIVFVVSDSAPPTLRDAAAAWAHEFAHRFGIHVQALGQQHAARTMHVVFGEAAVAGLSFAPPEAMAHEPSVAPLVQALSLALATPATLPLIETANLHTWIYWEGPRPDWIAACQDTLLRHAPNPRVLDRAGFEAMWDTDRDIDISRLHVAHRADFVRAYLLRRYGGLWLDSDCIAMKSLAPVLEHLATADYVGHRERGGLVSNAFMAARPGSVIAAALYDTVSSRLRSKEPLTWISLGNEPLTRIVDNATLRWVELDVEAVQPICWSRPEAYFERASAAEHARSLRCDALCYMLSNQNSVRHQNEHPGAVLTAPDTLFSFLVAQARGGKPPSSPRSALWYAPYFADVIVRLRPKSVLEIDPRSATWSELARECAEVPDGCRVTAVSGTSLPESRHDLIVAGPDARASKETLLAHADYVLFASAGCPQDALLSPALIESTLDRNGGGGRRGLAGLMSAHDPAGLRGQSDQVSTFAKMHANHTSEGQASTSGPGSTLQQTHEIRQRLPLVLQHLGAQSLLDAACGDFFWQRHTAFGVQRYVGTDVLDELVCRNRSAFGSDARLFLTRDARTDALPRCDAILCRDYLVHLCIEDVWRTLRNFAGSGSRFLIATTFPNRPAQPDIRNGEWRALNLCAPPFSLPAPELLINEKCTEGGGAFADKALGVWRLADLDGLRRP